MINDFIANTSSVRVDLELGVVAERRRPRPPGHVRQEQLLLREVDLKRAWVLKMSEKIQVDPTA